MFIFEYLLIATFAFLLGIVDASLGMGYGTLLTPILVVAGLNPLQVIPAVLVSQLAGDFLAAFFHHRFENVDFSLGSRHLKVALVLAILGLSGSLTAVLVAVNLPTFYLSLYVGISVAAVGIIILVARNRNYSFSWVRLTCLGAFASFNKGISGGGYGPIIVAGQIISGVEVKGAIGITTLAEGVTCAAAALSYFFVGRDIDLILALLLSLGITLSTPVAAFAVRKIKSHRIQMMIGLLAILVGFLTVFKTLQA